MNRARGAALVLVMWLIALLTALVGAYSMTARIEHMQGRVLSRGLVAEQAARAGLEYAMARLADPVVEAQWVPDGRPYAWVFGAARVEVRIIDESGKVDLNAAAEPLLSSLMRVVGADADSATAVATAIIDWRDSDSLSQASGGAEDPQYAAAERDHGAKDAPFETVGEVQQVLGMTPALYAAIEEHITVFSGQADPDQRYASAQVLQASGVDPTAILAQRQQGAALADPSLVGGGSGTYSVDCRARLDDGRQAILRAVVRAGPSGVPGSAYAPLRWEEGATPR